MADLYVSWSEYQEKIERLAVQVYRSDWDFQQIVCLAKGGLRVGDIFSRLFKKPLAILSVASYNGEKRGQIVFSEHLSMTTPSLGACLLLVDDLADSGITLLEAHHWLKRKYPHLQEIRSAVIWYKAASLVQPDYYVDYLADNPWIHQPFELYEQMNPEDLAAEFH
jgi:hypoxanthine phosphoribosyltransferase